MDEYTCKNCRYFQQHYTFDQRKIFRVYCGHCTFPRVKKRKPDAKICDHFQHNDTNEKAFVSKEYLSKELLQYLLNLELLPQIDDAQK